MLFVLAGLAEIGGGYLVWLWLREKKSILVGIMGAVILILYGVIPALQDYPQFGRVYAAYGGIFVALSLLWGWFVDKNRPDRYDWLGGLIALVGAFIIIWMPR